MVQQVSRFQKRKHPFRDPTLTLKIQKPLGGPRENYHKKPLKKAQTLPDEIRAKYNRVLMVQAPMQCEAKLLPGNPRALKNQVQKL